MKVGCQVMYLRNDSADLYNGLTGIVTEISNKPKKITVNFQGTGIKVVKVATTSEEATDPESGNIVVLWSRKQLPLKLSYGMTIHKSQGITIDPLAILFSERATDSSFWHGLAYTALSRGRSLQGKLKT